MSQTFLSEIQVVAIAGLTEVAAETLPFWQSSHPSQRRPKSRPGRELRENRPVSVVADPFATGDPLTRDPDRVQYRGLCVEVGPCPCVLENRSR